MSDGHAGRIAAGAAGTPAAGDTPLIDPMLYQRDDVRRILAAHDIGALYRMLMDDVGITQRTIAQLTGQSQSEVSEILKGRRVLAYDLLVRIAAGLGIPRELMGLSYGENGAYRGDEVPVADPPEGVSAEMRRRILLAAAGFAVVGRPLQELGELLELPGPSTVPMPSQLGAVHVAKVRNLTRELREAGRTYGSDPEVCSAAAGWASRLLHVSGIEAVKRALRAAVAELHAVAGWAAFDAGLPDRTIYHYTRALELATESGDAYLQATALTYAGLATVEHGHPNDGLKMLQLAQVKAWDIPRDHDRRTAVEAMAQAESATALAHLGLPDAANTELMKSRELWRPTRTDPNGDLDIVAARIEADRGRLDTAEPFAAASVRRWEGGSSKRAHTQAGIVLATIHVRAGEPDGLRLAHQAITGVTKLSSGRSRAQLSPLVGALDSRLSSDARELAHLARQVATTRM